MNIVFFGSSKFAVPSLKALKNTGYSITCVVTQPDREKGRGLQLVSTPVKEAAYESGIKIYQPLWVNKDETIDFLKELKADLFIVISYGQILSRKALDVPKILSLNVHASCLPRYRGAAPINWALINGETTTGITIIKMTEDMDAGPIISQKSVEIDNVDTTVTLEEKLSFVAAHLLTETIELVKSGNYKLTPQSEIGVTFAPKLKKENGLIDWTKSSSDIHNLIRGCVNWPGAFTYYNNRLLKILKAEAMEIASQSSKSVPGEIVDISKEGIFVATGKHCLVIKELQLEGKRIMSVKEFISGHKISIGEEFSKKIIA